MGGLGRGIRAIGKTISPPLELGYGHRLWQLDDNNVQDYSTIVILHTLLALIVMSRMFCLMSCLSRDVAENR